MIFIGACIVALLYVAVVAQMYLNYRSLRAWRAADTFRLEDER